ncbi:MAG: DMT family transporter [Amphritea sp.]
MLCLVSMWGTSFMFISLAIEGGFTPTAITSLRILLGAAILTCVVYFKGLRLPVDLRSWGAFMLLGLFGNAAPFFLISWGQQSVPSGTTGVLMAVMPLVTMVLAHYTVPNERLNRYKILGCIAAFTGVYLLLSPSMNGTTALLGQFAVLAAACCYAINTILIRLLPTFNPLVGSAGMLISAIVLTSPLYMHFGLQLPQQTDWLSIFSVIWMGVVPTGMASIIYFLVVERAGPSFLSNINFIIPVVAFLSGTLILAEPVTAQNIIALVIILTGIATTRFRVS